MLIFPSIIKFAGEINKLKMAIDMITILRVNPLTASTEYILSFLTTTLSTTF